MAFPAFWRISATEVPVQPVTGKGLRCSELEAMLWEPGFPSAHPKAAFQSQLSLSPHTSALFLGLDMPQLRLTCSCPGGTLSGYRNGVQAIGQVPVLPLSQETSLVSMGPFWGPEVLYTAQGQVGSGAADGGLPARVLPLPLPEPLCKMMGTL